MFTAQELYDDVVDPVLTLMSTLVPSRDQASPLLIGTSAVESKLGTYRRQLGDGPAQGIWQMEPATEHDIWQNFLAYNRKLADMVKSFRVDYTPEEMVWNDHYACAMARVFYYRIKAPLPAVGDLEGQARCWKQYYNTPLGAGTPEKYIESWKLLVEGRLVC